MKRKEITINLSLVIAFVIAIFGIICVGFSNQENNLYENMVDASVRISGCGSGVFIADDVILTAAHCIRGEKSFLIELSDGTKLKSENFWIDKKEDIAFVFVEAGELHIAKVSSVSVSIGDLVYLVGRPQADLFKFSLTKGIISHTDRDLPDMGWKDLLQTDAEGGPGSSGGPLYNSDGDIVGMYVGHSGGPIGGAGISLCESAKSILEAYQRCKDAQN